MPYENDSHLNFCWKEKYKDIILEAVEANGDDDLYGSYPESTMTIHAKCGLVPSLQEEEKDNSGGGGGTTPSGPSPEDDSAQYYSGLIFLWSLILFIW